MLLIFGKKYGFIVVLLKYDFVFVNCYRLLDGIIFGIIVLIIELFCVICDRL